MQVLFIIAAICLVLAAAEQPEGKDVVNAHIKKAEYFEWHSVDEGDKETHYKSFELFVSRCHHHTTTPDLSLLCVHRYPFGSSLFP